DWSSDVCSSDLFVEIPEGAFTMGSLPARDGNATELEQPQSAVEVPRFLIARYPVTVAQFAAFVREAEYRPTNEQSLRGVPNHPVTHVSWRDAQEYCRWLTPRLRD